MKIEFIGIEKYQFVHGRKPRGYGMWMFEFATYRFLKRPRRDGSRKAVEKSEAFHFTGNFSDACKAAKVAARDRGFEFVNLMA